MARKKSHIASKIVVIFLICFFGCNGVQQISEIKLLNDSESEAGYQFAQNYENQSGKKTNGSTFVIRIVRVEQNHKPEMKDEFQSKKNENSNGTEDMEEDIFSDSEENLSGNELIGNGGNLEELWNGNERYQTTEAISKLDNSYDKNGEFDYTRYYFGYKEADDETDEAIRMKPDTLMGKSPIFERFASSREIFNNSDGLSSEVGTFPYVEKEDTSPILKRVVRRACKCKPSGDSKDKDSEGHDSEDNEDGKSGEDSKGDGGSKGDDDKGGCGCKPDKDVSNEENQGEGETGLFGNCSIPKRMKHSELECKVTLKLVSCHQKCAFGYTTSHGIERTQICHEYIGKWFPSTRFSDCKPYVDCTVKMKYGGKKECRTNYMDKGNKCYISCKARKGKKYVKKKKYRCDIQGKWKPKLPHCAKAGTGIKLVPRPRKTHKDS